MRYTRRENLFRVAVVIMVVGVGASVLAAAFGFASAGKVALGVALLLAQLIYAYALIRYTQREEGKS